MSEEHRQPDASGPVRITLRPLGSSLPLGFFAFGCGMAVLGGIDLGFVPQPLYHQAAVVLLSFVGPLEGVAAILAFLARDGMSATGLGLFAGSWVTIGLQYVLGVPGRPSQVLALYLFAFTVVIFLLGLAATRGQPLLAAILLLSTVRTGIAGGYQLAGLGSWSGASALQTTAGVIGLVLTVLAFYGGFAFLLEDGAGATVLPLARRGRSRTSFEGSLADQVQQLESEAGVRRSL